jgi:DeoR/GlpR family transcriptional regulator of sugar metabolism
MLLSERQQQILEALLRMQSASVADLSAMFAVSAVTIRSDLSALADQGRVIRTRGGARIVDGRMRQELTFSTRQRIDADRKRQIGTLAASLVQPHDSILLDASTTVLAVGAALKRSPELRTLTVVTTGIWTALELLDTPHINVVLTGGYVRSTTGSIAGSITQRVLESFYFNRVFLGAWGLTMAEGLTDTHLAEVELKQAIIARAREVVAVLDGSKFGRLGLASFASIAQVSYVVTDERAPAAEVAALRERGVRVLVADG